MDPLGNRPTKENTKLRLKGRQMREALLNRKRFSTLQLGLI